MTLVGRPPRRSAPVTAAARVLPIRPSTGRPESPPGSVADDRKLWGYYRDVDVVHFGMSFKRNAALRARFFPALRGDDPFADPEPIDADESKRKPDERIAVDVFQTLDGGRGRIAETVGDMLVHLDVAGICFPVYQVRRAPGDDGELDRLTVYSTLEVRRQADGLLSRLDNQSRPIDGDWQINRDDIGATVWRPSPEHRSQPDSPLRAVADECDLLLAIASMFQASMLTRINAGILVVPDELRPPLPPTPPNGVRVPDPFLVDMTMAFQAPITNPAHPGRFQPYILSGPGEAAGKVQRVDLGRPITAADLALLELVQGRVATGLDLPPEIITGLAKMNHWGAWQVDATTYRQHVDPPVLLSLDGLTRYVYWKLLAAAGVKNPSQFVIWRDISGLTAAANRTADAIQLWDREVIGSASLRAVAGYDDTDARDDNPDPRPGTAAAGGPPVVEPEEEAVPDSPNPAGVAAAAPTVPVALVAAEPQPVSGRRLAELDRTLTIRLADAAEGASQRALDRAGARVRTQARRQDETLTAVIDSVPNRAVPWKIGRLALEERLGITAAELVAEEDFAGLETEARRLMDRAIASAAAEVERLGGASVPRDESEEGSSVDSAVALLVAAALASTRARLYTPGAEPDPADTGEVPDARAVSGRTLLDVTTVAGGGLAGVLPDGSGFDVGVGNGPRSVAWLRSVGLVTIAYRWVYGDRSARAVNFEPHLILEGVEFDRWDDPALTNRGTFPLGVQLHPGDHAGCLCGSERVLWFL